MNLRQKKKRYKRIYGQNPEKGSDGRYIFTAKSEKISPEQAKILQPIYAMKPEDIAYLCKSIKSVFSNVAKKISDYTAAAGKGANQLSELFSNLSDQYREPEDSIVVTTKRLSERRRKGGNTWNQRKGR